MHTWHAASELLSWILKKEIYDTWKPGTGSESAEVWDIAFGAGKVFAATGKGIYSADLSNPGLAYFGNWNLINNLPNPTGKYTLLIFSGSKLYANLSDPISGGDSVYAIDGISSLFLFKPGIFNTSFEPSAGGFAIAATASISYFNSDGSPNRTITSYGWGTPNISQAVADGISGLQILIQVLSEVKICLLFQH